MILVYKPTACPIKVRMRWRFGSSVSYDVAAGSMPNSEPYRRRRADECLAKQAHDEHERATLLRMAEQWERVAEHKGRRTRPPTEADLGLWVGDETQYDLFLGRNWSKALTFPKVTTLITN
jgi:hypothetical protein